MNVVDIDKLYHLIGKNIRNIRQEQKLSQAELAERLGFNRTSITNIEKGMQRPPVHFLYLFCLEFRKSLEEILPDPELVSQNLIETDEKVAISTSTDDVVVSRALADLIESVKQSAIEK